MSDRPVWSQCSHPDPGSQPTLRSSLHRGSSSHRCPSMCLDPGLEGLPPEPYTIQGRRAIPCGPSHMGQAEAAPVGKATVLFSSNAWPPCIQWQWIHSPEVKGCGAGLDASTETTHELAIPSILIGCRMGCQGAKINKMRQMSWVEIKIASPVKGPTNGQPTTPGPAASTSLVQHLSARLPSEMRSMARDWNNADSSMSSFGCSPLLIHLGSFWTVSNFGF